MEEYSRAAALHLAAGVQLAAAAVVTVACLRAAVRAFALLAQREIPGSATEATRLTLGRWLVLALEFQVAADILRTAATPTWTDLGQLAAVVVLRTVLNYVLRKEIAESAAREPGGEVTPPPPAGPTVSG
ncbi:MAG: DUF1622 domain-containing protein [Gemmataceae bacterium]|nr:DUF1622 domain-containing protein [Gemmataceae bacterium]